MLRFDEILCTFLVMSFAHCKEYMTCLISFSKFSYVLPILTCPRAVVNLRSICFGVNIFRCVVRSKRKFESNFASFPFGITLPLKTLRHFCLPLKSLLAFA